jgi:hypothetical protein
MPSPKYNLSSAQVCVSFTRRSRRANTKHKGAAPVGKEAAHVYRLFIFFVSLLSQVSQHATDAESQRCNKISTCSGKKYKEKNPFKRGAHDLYMTCRVVRGDTENTRNNNTHKGWAAAAEKRVAGSRFRGAKCTLRCVCLRGGCIVEIIASARRARGEANNKREGMEFFGLATDHIESCLFL